MMIMSFAWTVPAIVAREKSCTRRGWSEDYAKRFRSGDHVRAYDKSPRFGGRQIGVIELTENPCVSRDFPPADWFAEGFEYLESIGAMCGRVGPRQLWEMWLRERPALVVVRFRIIEVLEAEGISRSGANDD